MLIVSLTITLVVVVHRVSSEGRPGFLLEETAAQDTRLEVAEWFGPQTMIGHPRRAGLYKWWAEP